MRREVILLALPYGPVIDVLERVIARIGRSVGEVSEGDDLFRRSEHHAVHEVGLRFAAPRQVGEKGTGFGMPDVSEPHEGFCGDRLRPGTQHVPESAVRIGEAVEKIPVRVVGTSDHRRAVAEQHLQLLDALVHQAVPERGGLDAHARDGAADRDRLELGDHARHDALGEGRIDQRLVGGHSLDIHPPVDGAHREHVMKFANVQPLARRFGAVPE